ncbi:MAG: Hsp33 family molecular chaperone HslO [Pseudomonadota bacterium]
MSDNKAPDQTESDILHRFSFDDLPVRGQWVRLNQTLIDAFVNHKYPASLTRLLGEMFAAVAMFADNLKFEGAVTLQSSGQGHLTRSLVECRSQSFLRGLAQLNSDEQSSADSLKQWLGDGAMLAMSLIPDDPAQTAYQGLVELKESRLQFDLEHYFDVSEQLPTRLFLTCTTDPSPSVTGLLLQRLPEDDLANEVQIAQHEDGWSTVCALADTISEAELATLPVKQLLHRLFNELPCRLQPARALHFKCTCSRTKTDATLHMLGEQELREMLTEQSTITVSCELCGVDYRYDEIDVIRLIKSGPNQPTSDELH